MLRQKFKIQMLIPGLSCHDQVGLPAGKQCFNKRKSINTVLGDQKRKKLM
jgi:hypothetical protein